MSAPRPFELPPYPYDRLVPIREAAQRHRGGAVDLSVGTPCDPPPDSVLEVLRSAAAVSVSARGYPPSVGTAELRGAIVGWLARRFGVEIEPHHVAACIGTKEFVAGVPHWLRLREPARDTVLYPAVSYPSYAMGAELAGCRSVPVPVDAHWRLDLTAIDPADAARALCLWVNTPGNPTGALDDLHAAAQWGRAHGVPVLSDECYAEFTWAGGSGADPSGFDGQPPGRTILEAGPEGVLAVHSLSKRSNLAGLRVGFYAGDPELVHFLSELRKHAGFMVPGPTQAAGVAVLEDQTHVEAQRERYLRRLTRVGDLLASLGLDVNLPDGGFYLWIPAPQGDAWGLTRRLADDLGVVVSPGEFYGPEGARHVRVAVVQPDDVLDLLDERAERLA